MWKRLFIKTPLAIICAISCLTLIIPFVYWIITGEDYVEKIIDHLEEL